MFKPISLSIVPSKTTLGLKLTTLPDFCSIQTSNADQILLTALHSKNKCKNVSGSSVHITHF